MVDIGDLKSPDLNSRVGSSPTPGTLPMQVTLDRMGPLLTTLPSGFVPYHQWPEFDLLHYVLPHLEAAVVEGTPRGVRTGRWPIYFEEYVSDTEPAPLPDPKAPPRLLVWRRVVRADIPSGWQRLGWRASRLEGFAEIRGHDDEYEAHWSESARRYRRKWLSEGIPIESVSFAEFLNEYMESDLPLWVRKNYASIAERMHRGPQGKHIEMIAPRDPHSGRLLGGMMIINSPTCKASYYLCGFVASAAKDRPVMVGLMDHWFCASRERGYRFLHFGEFWLPGKSKHWKGFSEFKSKFGLSYVAYPPALVRPRGGTLWP